MDCALFLDFDGTLVDIAPTPDAVKVEAGLIENLETLRRRLGGALAIVSGRPIAQIDGFLAPSLLDAAGLHGVERRRDGDLEGGRPEDHPALRAQVERLHANPRRSLRCLSRIRAPPSPCIGGSPARRMRSARRRW